MTALNAALDALYANGNIARNATYIAEGGAPQLVRVVTRRADDTTSFGDAPRRKHSSIVHRNPAAAASSASVVPERA